MEELLVVAIVGGLVLAVPTLAVFALAIVWRRSLAAGGTLPGLPPRVGGEAGARVVGVVLVGTTLAYLVGLVIQTGPWTLLALPPAALALAAGRILIAP